MSLGLLMCTVMPGLQPAWAQSNFMIWGDSFTPAMPEAADPSPLALGVKFQSEVSGYIEGIRFYKGTNNTGLHVGKLWTSAGEELASVTFVGESAEGWQQQLFANPVPITAGTTYVASYHSPSGAFSLTANYFSPYVGGGYTNAPLVALGDGNGVFAYGGAESFPTTLGNAANYWVDVVFVQSAIQDKIAPTVVSVSPLAGAAGVSRSAPVVVRFSEAMDPATIANGITLSRSGGGLVASTVAYDAATFTATLAPIDLLALSRVYTVAVASGAMGVKDVAGNALANAFTASFTTTDQEAFRIWDNTFTPAVPEATDQTPLTLGIKFKSEEGGYITGIRFYKGANNTGLHVGKLWTSAGEELASVTFVGESAEGWQQQLFANPVPITAGTTYVASYHSPSGAFSLTANYFSPYVGGGYTNAPLVALGDGNGVFAYGGAESFPTATGNAANYWVDVVMVLEQNEDTTPPTLVCPDDVVLQCADCYMDPSNTGTATATDDSGSVTVNYDDAVSGECPKVAKRTWTATDAAGNSASCVQTITCRAETFVFLLIDDDCIDNSSPGYSLPPNTGHKRDYELQGRAFTDRDINDDRPGLAQRAPLRFFNDPANFGRVIVLRSGQTGDEGLFELKDCPASWNRAGPTTNGLLNFWGQPCAPYPHGVGPGLGTGKKPEAYLDKIPNVTPLRDSALSKLVGKVICGLVWDSDISMNYKPLNGSLKGEKLGVVAFRLLEVKQAIGFSSSTLPLLTVQIIDPCEAFSQVPQDEDTTPPTIVCPGDVVLQCADCNTDPSSTGTATATDDSGSVTVKYNDAVSGECPKVVKRTWTATDAAGNTASCVQTIMCKAETCVFLLIDEDCIDNTTPGYSLPPNTGHKRDYERRGRAFTDQDVNDDRPELAQRAPLRFFNDPANFGRVIVLPSGRIGDEGLFALMGHPASWSQVGPTANGLLNFSGQPCAPFPHGVGPGLGTGEDPEAYLDKIPNVLPLWTPAFSLLVGKVICGLVWDSDISMNYIPLNGSLKGEKLGVVAFRLLEVKQAIGFSFLTLPLLTVQIVDPCEAFSRVPSLYFDALPPVVKLKVKIEKGVCCLSFPTLADQNYAVEYAEADSPHKWRVLTLVAGTGSEVTVTEPIHSQRRLYRVRVETSTVEDKIRPGKKVDQRARPSSVLGAEEQERSLLTP